MSFWLKLGLEINDLTVFKESCKINNVRYEQNEDSNFQFRGAPVEATLFNAQDRNLSAYLTREGGGYKLHLDNDANYNNLTHSVGRNGGKLTQDYSVNVIRKQVRQSGGMVNMVTEQPDGSMLMRVSTM